MGTCDRICDGREGSEEGAIISEATVEGRQSSAMTDGTA